MSSMKTVLALCLASFITACGGGSDSGSGSGGISGLEMPERVEIVREED